MVYIADKDIKESDMNNIAIGSMPINLSISFSSVVERLSENTKKELQMLGFDTSSIKTEAQGQALLKSVKEQNTLKAQQSSQIQKESESDSRLRGILVGLLAEFGEVISQLESIVELFQKLLEKIKKLIKEAEAEANAEKKKKAEAYQAQYDKLLQEYSASQSSQSMLSSSMNNMAMMNKISLNLK